MVFNLMPIIAAIGIIVILCIWMLGRMLIKREQEKGISARQFREFAEEIKNQNAAIQKDLLTMKEKVESIDKMMKDI